MSALKYWIWLSAANVSVRTKWNIIDRYGDAKSAFMAPDGDFKKLGISGMELKELERRDTGSVQKIMDVCAAKGIDIITFQDVRYPRRLKNISFPPAVIYVRGKLPDVDDNAPIAVIGTRKASAYGLSMAKKLSYEIINCGAMLVSLVGGPIDEAALKGAMLAGGSCIGVLAAPLDESSRHEEDIAACGALVSELAPGTQVQKGHFKDRNRIAAGLSVGVLVIEAPEKSGTRLFCNEANEQGKEIFALPGNADSENSAGTLALIKEGAKLVTRGSEVMEEFQALYPDRIKLVTAQNMPEEENGTGDKSERPAAAAKAIDNPVNREYIDLKEQLEALSEDQLAIITAIEAPSSHIDDIIERTGFGAAKVLTQLTMLEIKGFVRREPGRRISVNTAKK